MHQPSNYTPAIVEKNLHVMLKRGYQNSVVNHLATNSTPKISTPIVDQVARELGIG